MYRGERDAVEYLRVDMPRTRGDILVEKPPEERLLRHGDNSRLEVEEQQHDRDRRDRGGFPVPDIGLAGIPNRLIGGIHDKRADHSRERDNQHREVVVVIPVERRGKKFTEAIRLPFLLEHGAGHRDKLIPLEIGQTLPPVVLVNPRGGVDTGVDIA